MFKYYMGTIIQYLITIIFALSLNFLLPRLMPGDPIKYLLGEDATSVTPEMRNQIMEDYGLNKSLGGQYVDYVKQLLHGDLGYSYQKNRPVWDVIADKLPWTLLLAGVNIVLTTVLGVVLGALAAWRRGKPTDITLGSIMVLLRSMPSFWLGMILIAVFGAKLGWLPTFGAKSAWSNYTGLANVLDVTKHLILPSITMLLLGISSIYMTMRYSMIDTLGEDYILLAMYKGVPDRAIRYRHAMRNALIPVVTIVMMSLGYIVGGAIIIETVFAYPGTGRLLFEALTARDYPLIQGCFLVTTMCVLVANIIADMIYPLVDPKVV